jgi:site-specific DNA-methyltransferase (adenine-specific)/modification methylase
VSPRIEHIAEGVTLYCGDCREILPTLGKVDAVVTDPPYGIAYKPLRGSNGSKMWGDATVRGDDAPFDPSPLLGHPAVILWGANNFAARLPDSNGWLIWDKCPRGPRVGFIYSHCEMAWTNFLGRTQKFALEWEGAARNGESFVHPTQKSTDLMRWCIELIPPPATLILDPFMGSGTTGVAAVKLGRKFTGIEIEPKYFDVACRRISEATKQTDLFIEKPKPARVEQATLFAANNQ